MFMSANRNYIVIIFDTVLQMLSRLKLGVLILLLLLISISSFQNAHDLSKGILHVVCWYYRIMFSVVTRGYSGYTGGK